MSGLTEMILVYTEEDRSEVATLLTAVRRTYGPEARTPAIVLRALRTLNAIVANQDNPAAAYAAAAAAAAGL